MDSTTMARRWQSLHWALWCRQTVASLCVLALIAPHHAWCEDFPIDTPSEQSQGGTYYQANIRFTYKDPRENYRPVNETFNGKFGTNLTKVKTLVKGKLVLVKSASSKNRAKKDNLGCSKKYVMDLPTVKWIALVERGDCNFSDKISFATVDNNASGVLIFDNDSNFHETYMKHREMPNTAAVIISRKFGLRFRDLLRDGAHIDLEIKRGPIRSVNQTSTNTNNSSVLFLSISFIIIVIISVTWLMFYYIRKFRYSHAKERLARRLARAAKKAIAKIPQKTVNAGDKELDEGFDQCAVCIEPYKDGDIIRCLPCRHVFHKSCVDPWLLDHRTCPMCKLDILQAYGMSTCKMDILRAYGIQGSQESVHRDPEATAGMHSAQTHAGGQRSPSAGLVLDDQEASSSLEDEEARDNAEVKVVLVPHSCLHYHHAARGSKAEGVLEEEEEEEYDHEDGAAEATTSLLASAAGNPVTAEDDGKAVRGSTGSLASLGSRTRGQDRGLSHSRKAGGESSSVETEALISSHHSAGGEECGDQHSGHSDLDSDKLSTKRKEGHGQAELGTDANDSDLVPFLNEEEVSTTDNVESTSCLVLEGEGAHELGSDARQSDV